MKHFLAIAIVFLSFITLNAQTKAQPAAEFKIAYFDMDSLLHLMPEYAIVTDSTLLYYAKLEVKMFGLNKEFEKKSVELASKDFSKESGDIKKAELEDLGQQINDYQQWAKEDYEAYRTKLLVPVFAKINAAAKKIAKEKGYAFVLDGSKAGTVIIFANETYNIFDEMCRALEIPQKK